jgi:spore coat protein U-like protein
MGARRIHGGVSFAAWWLLPVLLCWAATASGNSATATLDVRSNVVPICLIYTESVVFPDYVGVESSATGAVNVACNTPGHGFVIALDAGSYYAGGTYRRMSDRIGHFLRYTLTSDSGALWGDPGYGNTYLFGDVENGTAPGGYTFASFAAHGTIPGGQIVPEGFYLDTIQVTVDY